MGCWPLGHDDLASLYLCFGNGRKQFQPVPVSLEEDLFSEPVSARESVWVQSVLSSQWPGFLLRIKVANIITDGVHGIIREHGEWDKDMVVRHLLEGTWD